MIFSNTEFHVFAGGACFNTSASIAAFYAPHILVLISARIVQVWTYYFILFTSYNAMIQYYSSFVNHTGSRQTQTDYILMEQKCSK